MNKVTVTYKAPKGDSKVVEVFGCTFFDGKPETVDLDDHALEKLKNHPLFECSEAKDPPPKDPPKQPDPKGR